MNVFEVPPVQERAYTRASSSHAIRSALWHPELPRSGQGRGEDFYAQRTPDYERLEKTQDYKIRL